MADYKKIKQAIIDITQYMLESVSPDGSWGTLDFTNWGPIITALNIEHLLRCGVPIDKEWSVSGGQGEYICSIRKSLQYLNQNVHENGSFGADFWDTCKLARIIKQYGLESFFDYEKIHSYIVEFVKTDGLLKQANDNSASGEWSGPGTYAACADYLLISDQPNDHSLAKAIIDEALKLQQANGSFTGKKKKTGDNVIHPVWHTAQMLMVLVKSSYQYDEGLINSIANWIIDVQGDSGEYGDFGQYVSYYTGYAILAFQALPCVPRINLEKALEFMLNRVQGGKVDDFGGTVMAVEAFDSYIKQNDLQDIYHIIQVEKNELLLADNLRLEHEILTLSEELQTFKDKYKDADIVLSKKEVWKLGIWISTVILILGIIFPIIVNIIIDSIQNKMIQESTQTIYSEVEFDSQNGED